MMRRQVPLVLFIKKMPWFAADMYALRLSTPVAQISEIQVLTSMKEGMVGFLAFDIYAYKLEEL